jgi:hypothetical protein
MMDRPQLPLADMAQRHRGLTPAIADSYVEASRVCLDRHHIPPVVFDIEDGRGVAEAVVNWSVTDPRTRDAWANQIDATEAGAYAFAIAATELTRGLFAVRRAETLSGADYYVAPLAHDPDDLEGCLRLEVSGTSSADRNDVDARLRQKLKQTEAGRSNLPALAAVVGFSVRIIKMALMELT